MMVLDKRMREIFHKVQLPLFESAQKSTIQLFHNDKPEWEKSMPEPVGSGVFIKLDDCYYIVTAAHVVQGYALKKLRNPYRSDDDYDDSSEAHLTLNNIGIFYNQSYYPIQRVVFTNVENGIIENNVDLAVLFLDLESAEELKQSFIFVSINRMILNHTINTKSRYFIYGYPADWTEIVDSTEKIISKPFKYITKGILVQELTNISHYDARYNILLSYDKRIMVYTESGQPLEDFCPKGISGCGLWYYAGRQGLSLIGIMIEDKWTQQQQPLMMATRIDEVIAIIRKAKSQDE